MRKILKCLFACTFMLVFTAEVVWAEVATGTKQEWAHSIPVPGQTFSRIESFRFDDEVSVVSDIAITWSPGIFGQSAHFQPASNSGSTKIARLSGDMELCELTDASLLQYSNIANAVFEGSILVFRNLDTGYYAALKLDDVNGTDYSSSRINVTWYLQEDNSSGFGPCPSMSSLEISPPTGTFVASQDFDLALIVESKDLSVVGTSAIFDGSDVTAILNNCTIPGALISGGLTLRCPGLTGKTLGIGNHSLDITLDLSDGSSVNDVVTWEIKENVE